MGTTQIPKFQPTHMAGLSSDSGPVDTLASGVIPLLRGGGPWGPVTLVVLVLAGMAGNYFKVTLFFNADFIFGNLFAMLALQLYGWRWGLAAAFLINCPLYFLWWHPYATLIMTAEVAVVAWLSGRRKVGFVQADAIYWITLGMPLVYLFYHFVMKVPVGNTLFIMAKDTVNGVANALLSRLLFIPLAMKLYRWRLSYLEGLKNLLAVFVLIPALIMIAFESRKDFRASDQRIRSLLDQDARRLGASVEVWVSDRESAVVNLARLASFHSPQQMQSYLDLIKHSDGHFLRMGLLDRGATITAYSPLIDELGEKISARILLIAPSSQSSDRP